MGHRRQPRVNGRRSNFANGHWNNAIHLDNLANTGSSTLEERELIEAFVQRGEVDPEI
jgi:hypothetical protein